MKRPFIMPFHLPQQIPSLDYLKWKHTPQSISDSRFERLNQMAFWCIMQVNFKINAMIMYFKIKILLWNIIIDEILLLTQFSGKASDFIAVELIRGKIHYILNLGYGPINIRDASSVNVSDNKWHEVSIGRPSRYRHTLMVDGHITEQNTQGDNYHLDLDGILFLGNYLNEYQTGSF